MRRLRDYREADKMTVAFNVLAVTVSGSKLPSAGSAVTTKAILRAPPKLAAAPTWRVASAAPPPTVCTTKRVFSAVVATETHSAGGSVLARSTTTTWLPRSCGQTEKLVSLEPAL